MRRGASGGGGEERRKQRQEAPRSSPPPPEEAEEAFRGAPRPERRCLRLPLSRLRPQVKVLLVKNEGECEGERTCSAPVQLSSSVLKCLPCCLCKRLVPGRRLQSTLLHK